MRVHLSLATHGVRPERPATTSGVVSLRGEVFIEALEQRLALPPVVSPPGEALLTYRACLEAADNVDRFYHTSLAVDPINVTRTLLDWRARFYLHGWSGRVPGDAGVRLRDLADVEQQALTRVQLSLGQRLNRLSDALAGGRRAGVDEVVLAQPLVRAPRAWRRLLSHFSVAEDCSTSTWSAPPTTDLGRAQRALAGGSVEGERVRLEGDGSLFLLRAVSRDLSAEAVARYVDARGADGIVIIAEHDGIIVDNALERVGLARAGFQHYSAFRGITQVLKLALAQLWRPVSAHALLQFLQHPVGPIGRRVRRGLAAAVAEQPGIGGRPWRTYVDALGDTERRDVRRWLEHQRFDPAAGALLEHVVERCRGVADWIARAGHTIAGPAEERLYGAALGQARALIVALDALATAGRQRVARAELDALLDEVMARAGDPGTFAQAGHVCGATNLDEIEPTAEIIWWDLKGSAELWVGPFTSDERAALLRAGVALPSAEQQVAWHREDMLRVLMCATARLVLVVHERDGSRHLLESMLEGRLDGLPVVDLEAQLLGGHDAIGGLSLHTERLGRRALPPVIAHWQLPADVHIEARATESYSSLDKLIHHPHIWVLHYAAGLRPGRAAELPDGPLLYGNLAHLLIERYFTEHAQNWRVADVSAWLAAVVPELVEQSGALLGELGRGIDHQRVTAQLERALPELLDQLAVANVVTVNCEAKLDATLVPDVGLQGAVDLWVTRQDGAMAVVDIKWGGERARAKLLAENRHLQLATYAHLVASRTAGPWPAQAYFIVSAARLLATDRRFFPNATVATRTANEDAEALWRRAVASYRWRRAQLDRGYVEVVVTGTESAERELPPADALGSDGEPDRFDVFGALTGWDDLR